MFFNKLLPFFFLSLFVSNFKTVISTPFRADVLSNGSKKVILYYDLHDQVGTEDSKRLFIDLCQKANLSQRPINFLIEGLDDKSNLKTDTRSFDELISQINASPQNLTFLSSFDWIESNKNSVPQKLKFYDIDLKSREMVGDYLNIRHRFNVVDYFYSNLEEHYEDYDISIEQRIPESVKLFFRSNPTNVSFQHYFIREENIKYVNFTFKNFFELIREERDAVINSLRIACARNVQMEREIAEIIEHAESRIREWINLLSQDEFLIQLFDGTEREEGFTKQENFDYMLSNLPVAYILYSGLMLNEGLPEGEESQITRTLGMILGSPDAALCRIVDIKTLDRLTNEGSEELSVVFLGGFHANQVARYLKDLGYQDTPESIPARNLEDEIYPDFYSAYYADKDLKLLNSDCFNLILQ